MIAANKDLRTKARLRSTRGKGAGAWLTTLPITSALTLSDVHFGFASRLRLGLPPHDHLPRNCTCGYQLESDPTHFLACQSLNVQQLPSGIIWRSNACQVCCRREM